MWLFLITNRITFNDYFQLSICSTSIRISHSILLRLRRHLQFFTTHPMSSIFNRRTIEGGISSTVTRQSPGHSIGMQQAGDLTPT